jgi:hypothetical protein
MTPKTLKKTLKISTNHSNNSVTASRKHPYRGSHPVPLSFPFDTRLCVHPRFRSRSRGPLGGIGRPNNLDNPSKHSNWLSGELSATLKTPPYPPSTNLSNPAAASSL